MEKTKIIRFAVVLVMVAALSMTCAPMSALAASNPYKDVTTKTVASKEYKAIKYVKAHKGYKGIVKGKKFSPKKKITRREYIVMLSNFYGKKNVPVNIGDVINANKVATYDWIYKKTSAVCMVLMGEPANAYNKLKGKATREKASLILYNFATAAPEVAPKR